MSPQRLKRSVLGIVFALFIAICTAGILAQSTAFADTGCCGPITPGGQHLLQVLLSMDVEHLWQAKTKVHWRSGLPRPGRGHTHCSAFAAAAADRLNIYLLRPPAHSSELLASAQGRWLGSESGYRDGWRPVYTPADAQTLANQGELVVLDFINNNDHLPGHIAIVRPAVKSASALAKDGPETIQAGAHNFNDGTAVQSFAKHKGAWPNEIRMYAHTIDFTAPPPPPTKDHDSDD